MGNDPTCPVCGHHCRVSAAAPGQTVRCSACFNVFIPAPSPTAPAAAPAPAALPSAAPAGPAPNRTILAQPEAMVRYNCPRCKEPLESPASFAGQKLNCPDCGQRLQIPLQAAPAAAPPVNKTVLATEASAAPPPAPSPAPPLPAVIALPQTAAPVAPAPRRECCLECGTDVSQLSRAQSCPDCGAPLCSSRCSREHRRYAHDTRKDRPRTRYVECPHCGSTARPYSSTTISGGGWVTFAVLLVFFFPLCWLGLLMTESRMNCADCGVILS